MNAKLIALLSIAALATTAHALRTDGGAKPGSRAVDATVGDTGRVEGHEAFDFDATVGAILEASLLPQVRDASGQDVRAISAVLMYQKGTTYLGTANFHQFVPSDSTRVIDLSLDQLDLSIDDTSPNAIEQMRAFRATIAPRAGFTWGTVRTFKDHVVLEYAPL